MEKSGWGENKQKRDRHLLTQSTIVLDKVVCAEK